MAKNTRAAIRDLWVSGTLGSFFFIATSTIPKFSSAAFPPTDWQASKGPMLLRLGYAVWLLAYFFISNLDNADHPEPTKTDVWFDVLQSLASLLAAFGLGLAAPKFGFYRDDELSWALASASAAILLIAVLSLAFYIAKGKSSHSVNYLRGATAFLAVSELIAVWRLSGGFLLTWSWGVLAALTIVLVRYCTDPTRGIGSAANATEESTITESNKEIGWRKTNWKKFYNQPIALLVGSILILAGAAVSAGLHG